MSVGRLIDYKLRLHGVGLRWRTEISAWEPPYRFVDQQLRGPYKTWIHEHTFEELGPETTRVSDRVQYQPRGGALIHRLFVQPDLAKIFDYRHARLEAIFADADAVGAHP